jgi:hypothetical protein
MRDVRRNREQKEARDRSIRSENPIKGSIHLSLRAQRTPAQSNPDFAISLARESRGLYGSRA